MYHLYGTNNLLSNILWLGDKVMYAMKTTWNYFWSLDGYDWTGIGVTGLAFTVGMKTGTMIYNAAPAEQGRTRKGENYRKKVHRSVKKHYPNRKKYIGKNKKVFCPTDPEVRALMSHAPRFNNLVRPDRYESPRQRRIVYLQSQIMVIKEEMSRLNHLLKKYQKELATLRKGGNGYNKSRTVTASKRHGSRLNPNKTKKRPGWVLMP